MLGSLLMLFGAGAYAAGKVKQDMIMDGNREWMRELGQNVEFRADGNLYWVWGHPFIVAKASHKRYNTPLPGNYVTDNDLFMGVNGSCETDPFEKWIDPAILCIGGENNPWINQLDKSRSWGNPSIGEIRLIDWDNYRVVSYEEYGYGRLFDIKKDYMDERISLIETESLGLDKVRYWYTGDFSKETIERSELASLILTGTDKLFDKFKEDVWDTPWTYIDEEGRLFSPWVAEGSYEGKPPYYLAYANIWDKLEGVSKWDVFDKESRNLPEVLPVHDRPWDVKYWRRKYRRAGVNGKTQWSWVDYKGRTIDFIAKAKTYLINPDWENMRIKEISDVINAGYFPPAKNSIENRPFQFMHPSENWNKLVVYMRPRGEEKWRLVSKPNAQPWVYEDIGEAQYMTHEASELRYLYGLDTRENISIDYCTEEEYNFRTDLYSDCMDIHNCYFVK